MNLVILIQQVYIVVLIEIVILTSFRQLFWFLLNFRYPTMRQQLDTPFISFMYFSPQKSSVIVRFTLQCSQVYFTNFLFSFARRYLVIFCRILLVHCFIRCQRPPYHFPTPQSQPRYQQLFLQRKCLSPDKRKKGLKLSFSFAPNWVQQSISLLFRTTKIMFQKIIYIS